MLHLNVHSVTALAHHLTVVLLMLTHSCRGESQVITPSQPVVALLGDDIILPCRLVPPMDAFEMTVEWARLDLNPRFVYVWRDGVELESKKHQMYSGRTSLFIDELKLGNTSMKISRVRIPDGGHYKCFFPALSRASTVELVVGSVSSPIIEMYNTTRGVILQCDSTGWYPEPELFWLDGEGNLLSAGPPETVRGPDDLYTVSSRVTVEKRHSNSFTCRVTQKKTNQTRETTIQVPDGFFKVQSSLPIIIGVTVGVIVLIVAAAFVVRKMRQKKNKMEKGRENNKQDGEGKTKSENQHLMDSGGNVKEEAKQNQDEGREKKNSTVSSDTDSSTAAKTTEETLLDNSQRRDNEQKDSEEMETAHVENQSEISQQKEAAVKLDDKKLSSEEKDTVKSRVKEIENPSQETQPKSKDETFDKDKQMLNNQKAASTIIKTFKAQIGESEEKTKAESQQAQKTTKKEAGKDYAFVPRM